MVQFVCDTCGHVATLFGAERLGLFDAYSGLQ
jgi:hypothetical protein